MKKPEDDMAINSYVLGNVIRFTYECRVGGVLTDAGTRALTILLPDKATKEGPFTMDRVSAGTYEYLYEPARDAAHQGGFQVRVETTDPDSADERQFVVKRTRFIP
jgi:hypothetical protein